jgi:NADH:ubiquinone oxidoreductase subunit F (NADH-binding)
LTGSQAYVSQFCTDNEGCKKRIGEEDFQEVYSAGCDRCTCGIGEEPVWAILEKLIEEKRVYFDWGRLENTGDSAVEHKVCHINVGEARKWVLLLRSAWLMDWSK